jgi:hypothetical protein
VASHTRHVCDRGGVSPLRSQTGNQRLSKRREGNLSDMGAECTHRWACPNKKMVNKPRSGQKQAERGRQGDGKGTAIAM